MVCYGVQQGHVQSHTGAQRFATVSGLNDMFPGNGVQRNATGFRSVFSCLVGVSEMSAQSAARCIKPRDSKETARSMGSSWMLSFILDGKETADYSNIQELKYVDMVICEALRLYPPAFRYAREIEQDCVINGQLLPKGGSLEIPAGFLHYDPEHWPEPEKFIPERFTPEAKASRHPFVYLPFGAGPRSCVGMRLAQVEIKMALVHIFRRFNVVSCEDTKVPLELKSTTTLGPKNGIFVKITKREHYEEES